MSTQKNEHNPDGNIVRDILGEPVKVTPKLVTPEELKEELRRMVATPPTDMTGSGREGETPGKPALLPFLVTVLSERHHIGSVTTGAQAAIIHARDPNSALGVGVKRYKDENPEAAISNTDVVPINMEAMPLVIELRAQVEALRRDVKAAERRAAIWMSMIHGLPTEINAQFHESAKRFDDRAAIDSAQRQEGM